MKLSEVVNGSVGLVGIFVGLVVIFAGVTVGVYLGFALIEKLVR